MNSILFQRGIYPGESFTSEQNYGITVLMSTDPKIKDFLCTVLTQLEGKCLVPSQFHANFFLLLSFHFSISEWLQKDQVDKVSMIIKNVAADEVVECWDFKVTSEPIMEGSDPNKVKSDKDLKKIQAEIRDVMRQIAATVSYLPLLECNCSFDVLIHTRENVEKPDGWGETSNVEIKDGQTVQLKTFSTGLQKVDTIVSYKMNE